MTSGIRIKNGQGLDPCLFLDCFKGSFRDLLPVMSRNHEIVSGNRGKPFVMPFPVTDKVTSFTLEQLLEL